MEVRVFVAVSVDGFIARQDGAIDWLPQPDGSAEDYGYQEFLNASDVLLMGRRTFETVLGFGEWPYGSLPVVVASSCLSREGFPSWVPGTVDVSSRPLVDLLEDLERRGFQSIYVDGGMLIQSLLRLGAVRELVLTRIPVLLGTGRPLFGPVDGDVGLEHQQTRSWANGLVQSRYRLSR